MIKNYIYQFIYQLMNIIFPILTLPYISKVLGAENLGMYTYSFSIITYLVFNLSACLKFAFMFLFK